MDDGFALVANGAATYDVGMVSIRGKLIDPRHVELAEPVPPGEDSIHVQLVDSEADDAPTSPLLTQNPSFDFLRDEPDLYE